MIERLRKLAGDRFSVELVSGINRYYIIKCKKCGEVVYYTDGVNVDCCELCLARYFMRTHECR